MNREELEKMFDEKVTSMRIYDEYRNEITDDIKKFIFNELIFEVLNSVLPKWNKQTYISTYENYIKPKIKELYNINL